MTTGSGIFSMHQRKPGDSISEYSLSIATKSQVGGAPGLLSAPSQGLAQAQKKDRSLSSIIKSEVLSWYLFKSGLRDPRVNAMTHEQALNEGTMLVTDSAVKKQELIFESLRQIPPEATPLERPDSILCAPLKSQRSVEATKRHFKPRQEVWSTEVKEFFEKSTQQQSLADQVLDKVRLLRPELVPIKSIFNRASNKPHRQLWREVETSLIGALLYHSDSMADAKKLLAIDNNVCVEFAKRKQQGADVDPQLNTEQC